MSEMAPLMMVRRGDFLVPLTPMDSEMVRELPANKPLRVEAKMPRRSYRQLRLYWSLLRLVAENLEQDIHHKDLHNWIKLRLGLVSEIKLRSGEIASVPKSIAFDEMDHPEFTAFFAKVKALVTTQIIPGLGNDALEREALAMLGEAA